MKKRKQKKRKLSVSEEINSSPIKVKDVPQHTKRLNLKPVPQHIKHLVEPDDLLLLVKPDGACGLNAGALHILEDEGEGTRLWHVVNIHISDRWSYYGNKIGFPYKRQNGLKGEWVDFDEKKSAYLWTDNEELHAIANLYQINIIIISVNGDNDSNYGNYDHYYNKVIDRKFSPCFYDCTHMTHPLVLLARGLVNIKQNWL